MKAGQILTGQILMVIGIAVLGSWTATQWTASRLGFQMRLGEPWFECLGWPIYHPWRLFEWWYAFDAYAPEIFNRGGAIAASSAALAALAAIGASVWRARQSRLTTTYGSARWAEKREIEAAGLHKPAGIFLGRM